jgi:hydroxymethylbilane synthase
MATPSPLRIGTRGSLLAMAQAHETQRLLSAAFPELAAEGAMEIVEINTTGDIVQDRALSEVGGKGLFSKEIDAALLDKRIDIAVHSMKDLETWMPDGISLLCALEREDPRDVLITDKADSLANLPAGSLIGTSSLRRQAQILQRRPDLKVGLFRGNVQTRLRKLSEGVADATLLALAGLNRLGNTEVVTEILDPDVLLPAVAQGAIGISCRTDDQPSSDFIRAINHPETMARVSCERAMLEALDGSCRTPVGGLSEIQADGSLVLRGLVAKADGSEVYETTRQGPVSDGIAMGTDAGDELRRRAGPDIFE